MLSSIYQYAERNWFPVTIGIFLFPFFCIAFGALGFLLGLPLTKWHGVLILTITPFIVHRISDTGKERLINAILTLFIILLSLFSASLCFDQSIDGQYYHLPSGICLAKGWNPVWDNSLESFLDGINIPSNEVKLSHVEFFPKGQAINVGIAYLLTGCINAGGYVNYIFMFVIFIISYQSLKTLYCKSTLINVITSLLITLNPISLSCLSCSHIDGLLGMSIGIITLSTIAWLKTGDFRWRPFIVISALSAILLKFTGPVYIAMIGLTFSVPFILNTSIIKNQLHRLGIDSYIVKKDFSVISIKSWGLLLFEISLLAIVLGFHPYITNLKNYSSPFYPLHSFNKQKFPVENILDPYNNCCEDFANANPVQRFLYSHIIGQPGDFINISEEGFICKTSRIGIISNSPAFALGAFNAFGWVFGLSLVASFLLLFFLKNYDAWLIIIGLCLSVVVQPNAWWARFVPQLWYIPILIFYFLYQQSELQPYYTRSFKLLIGGISCLMIIQSLYTFIWIVLSIVAHSTLDMVFLEKMENNPGGRLASIAIVTPVYSGNVIQYHDHSVFHNKELLVSLGLENISATSPLTTRPLREMVVCRNGLFLYYLPDAPNSFNYTDEQIELDKNDLSFTSCYNSFIKLLLLRCKQLKHAWFT